MPHLESPARAALAVVGGGPAGLEAARAFRQQGGEGSVIMISAEVDPPYERPALSKSLLRGDQAPEEVGLETADFYAGHGIELRLGTTVVGLDPAARVLALSSGELVPFDRCVLTTGASPTRLAVPGGDDPRVRSLRSLADARTLIASVGGAQSAVVVGSGFIGCEAAASLAMRGTRVQMITSEDAPQTARLGTEVGQHLASWLDRLDVEMITGAEVVRVDDGHRVHVAGGRPAYEADLVLAATGVAPRGDLAELAGLEVQDGRVLVDEHMQTSADGVLAAGDVALAVNRAAGRRLAVEHWGEALEMGRVAGSVAAGVTAAWAQAPGFWSTIGEHTIKHVAWGDGHDDVRVVEHAGGAFTAWYGSRGTTVGVLTHERDDDHERGRGAVEEGRPLPS